MGIFYSSKVSPIVLKLLNKYDIVIENFSIIAYNADSMTERHSVIARRVTTPDQKNTGTSITNEVIYNGLVRKPYNPTVVTRSSVSYFNESAENLSKNLFKKTENEFAFKSAYFGLSIGAGIGSAASAGLFIIENVVHRQVEALSYFNSGLELVVAAGLGIASIAWLRAGQRRDIKGKRMQVDLDAVENLINNKENPRVEISPILVRRLKSL